MPDLSDIQTEAERARAVADLLGAWQREGWEKQDDDGFLGLVGPLWQRQDEDGWRLRLLAQPKHHNRRGVVHGGVLMTFADRAMGTVVRGMTAGNPQATVQLDMHFLDAAEVGDVIEATCRIEKATRTLVFVQGTLAVGTRVVATAKGIWKLLRPAMLAAAP
jgi:uncharacterized protein (TIGR00369 family)